MLRLLIALLAVLPALAVADVPVNAKQQLPTLISAQRAIWPEAPMPEFLAGQVEQESCITLKHSKCWNPTAQLKTSREWGRGLGQVTTSYRADGTVRFDKQEELRQQFPSLAGWTTAKWADATFQLTAIVEMDKSIYARQRDTYSDRDRLAFTLAAYNGGEGGVLQDRRLCANTKGCNPARWDGHVERTSLKSKTPNKGYGKSFFEINREYVTNILDVRRQKYEPYFRGYTP